MPPATTGSLTSLSATTSSTYSSTEQSEKPSDEGTDEVTEESTHSVTVKTDVADKGIPQEPDLQTTIIQTGIAAHEFLTVLQPTLTKGELLKPAGENSVVLTATSSTVGRVSAIADKIREFAKVPQSRLVLEGVLLASADAFSSNTLTSDELRSLLEQFGVVADDLKALAFPQDVLRLANISLPVNGSGELKAAMTDQLDLLLKLEVGPAEVHAATATVTENPSIHPASESTKNGKLLMKNDFQLVEGKAVVLGISRPSRTIALILRLKSIKE